MMTAYDAWLSSNEKTRKIISGSTAMLILALVLSWLTIDNQSFWLDELGTWSYAKSPSLSIWLHDFINSANSDGQLPLYHFLMFL